MDGGGRFQLQRVGAVCRGGLHLGSIYLVDKIGPAAPMHLAVLDKAAEKLSTIKGPWIIGGDFNSTPEELAEIGFLDLVQGVAHYPSEPTCGRKIFDYFIVSKHLSSSVYAVRPVVDGASKPHCSVRFGRNNEVDFVPTESELRHSIKLHDGGGDGFVDDKIVHAPRLSHAWKVRGLVRGGNSAVSTINDGGCPLQEVRRLLLRVQPNDPRTSTGFRCFNRLYQQVYIPD